MTALTWPRLQRRNIHRRGGWLRNLDPKALDVLVFYRFHRRSARGYIGLTSPEGRHYRIYLEPERPTLTCICGDYEFRHMFGSTLCKHGRGVRAGYNLARLEVV